MTFLEIVNRVLRRLREDQVAATTSTEYSELIADFVSDIHQEVCQADEWASFEHEINVDFVADQRQYNLGLTVAGGGAVPNTERVTTDQSMLLYLGTMPQAWYFDDSSDKDGEPMTRASREVIEHLYQSDRDMTDSEPVTFSLEQHPDNDGYLMTVWPTPSATGRVRIRFYTPEAELALDGTDDATEIRAPNRPIFLGALFMTMNERGEEIGEPGGILERRYYDALSAAKETNNERKARTDSFEFVRD